MKYFYCFRGDKEDLKDILIDVTIKKYINTKIFWGKHVIVGFNYNFRAEHASYLVIKYGDFIVNESDIFGDRAPILFKDHSPVDLQNPNLIKRAK